MKKVNLLLLSLLLTVVSSLFAQTPPPEGGIKINTGLDASVSDIKSFGKDTLIVYGANSKILKTVDAGETWNTVFASSSTSFRAMDWVTDKIGYALMSNKLVKTTDQGDNWEMVSTFDEGMSKMFVVDEDTLYVATGEGIYGIVEKPAKVMKSTDGGDSWTEVFACTPHQCDFEDEYERSTCGGVWLNGMFFAENMGYIVTGELCPLFEGEEYGRYTDRYVIYRSIDYGNSWDTIQIVHNDWDYIGYGFVAFNKHCTEIYFTSPTSGRLYLEGVELQTEDGFASYETIDDSTLGCCHPFASSSTVISSRVKGRSCDHTVARFRKNGNHTMVTSVYYVPKYGEFWTVYTLAYFADKNNMWGCKGFSDANRNEFYCIEIVNDDLFYLGCQNGVIRNYFEPPTEVREIGLSTINVYPNPVENELQIDGGELKLKEIEIYDLTGRKVKSVSCNNQSQLTIPTSDLKRGMYVFKIYTEKGVMVKKVNKN